MTPSGASVAEVRRPGQEKKRFFTTYYPWSGHKYLPAKRRNRCQHTVLRGLRHRKKLRCTSSFRMVTSKPYLLYVPFVDSDHVTLSRRQSLYNAIPPYILRSDTDHVGRARHKAGPIPYDQHPCHRDDRFLPAAARMPYPGELRKEHRILGYGHP